MALGAKLIIPSSSSIRHTISKEGSLVLWDETKSSLTFCECTYGLGTAVSANSQVE